MGATRIGLAVRKRWPGNLDSRISGAGQPRAQLTEAAREYVRPPEASARGGRERLSRGGEPRKARDLVGSVTRRAGERGTARAVVFPGAQTLSCMVIVCIEGLAKHGGRRMAGFGRGGGGRVGPASRGGLAIGRWRALTALTVVLAGLSALLAIQKRQLRVEAEELRQTVRRQVDFPHAGMVVPAFDGVTLEGDEVRVGVAASGTRQVLFMLDTRCGNCLVTLPAWNRMTEAVGADDASVEVYGLSLDPAPETRAYVEEHGLRFPVVLFDDERYRELYRVRGIPITLVVDEIGAVEYVRLGSIFGEQADPVVDSVVTAAAAGP